MGPLTPILGAIAPAVIAPLCALILTARVKSRSRPGWAHGVAAWATGIGAAVGVAFVLGAAALRPRQTTDWIGYLVVLLPAIACIELMIFDQRPGRIVLRIAVTATFALFLLLPPIRGSWPWYASAASVTIVVTLLVMLWELHDKSAHRGNPALTAAILLTALAGGSAKLAQLAGAVVSAFGAIAVLAWFNPRRFPIAGAVAVAWPASALTWLLGHIYSEAPLVPIALILLSGLTPLALRVKFLHPRPRWQGPVVCALVSIALAAAAVLLAYRSYETSDYGY